MSLILCLLHTSSWLLSVRNPRTPAPARRRLLSPSRWPVQPWPRPPLHPWDLGCPQEQELPGDRCPAAQERAQGAHTAPCCPGLRVQPCPGPGPGPQTLDPGPGPRTLDPDPGPQTPDPGPRHQTPDPRPQTLAPPPGTHMAGRGLQHHPVPPVTAAQGSVGRRILGMTCGLCPRCPLNTAQLSRK